MSQFDAIFASFKYSQFDWQEAGRAQYQHDRYRAVSVMPQVVFHPESLEDVSQLLKTANDQQIPVTVRGAGTATTGAATPVLGGILVVFDRMAQILELDADNQTITVQPGVITQSIQHAALEQGLFYPPDPASLETSTIGGNVATNAGGAHAYKYGVTRQYVLGLSGFWASGEPFEFGGKQLKQAIGYDLKQLLIGSEGTLGVITQIILRLQPKPVHQLDLMILFDDFRQAVGFFRKIKKRHIVPAAIEFLDHRCILAANNYLGDSFDMAAHKAAVIIQLHAARQDEIYFHLEQITDALSGFLGSRIIYADDTAQKQRIWSIRRCLSDALREQYSHKISYDIVVPPDSVEKMMQFLHELDSSSDLVILGFGHFGDGNIHVNILLEAKDQTKWQGLEPIAAKKILEFAVGLGGTISGEHGIGLAKKKYLSLVCNQDQIELMAQIKKMVDPHNILNPGKIF